jgi:hypothetical protein
VSAAVLLAAFALAGRWTGPAAAPPDLRPSAFPTTLASPPAADPANGEEKPRPTRDPFRYADEPAPRAETRGGPLPPALTPSVTPSPEREVRLVGLVRRLDGLRAAVAIAGEVVILRPGESSGGWTLVALDEDGARLRGPDGREEALTFPE